MCPLKNLSISSRLSVFDSISYNPFYFHKVGSNVPSLITETVFFSWSVKVKDFSVVSIFPKKHLFHCVWVFFSLLLFSFLSFHCNFILCLLLALVLIYSFFSDDVVRWKVRLLIPHLPPS